MGRRVRKLFIGLDVHKRETQACVMDADGKVVVTTRLKSDRKKLHGFLSRYPGAKVAIEASSVWEWAYDTAEEAGTNPVLTNPRKTRMIAESAVKTDEIDARTLANLLRTGYIVLAYAPPKPIRELRKKLWTRVSLVHQRTRFKNKVHADLLQASLKCPVENAFTREGRAWLHSLKIPRVEMSLRLVDAVDAEIDLVDKQINELADANEDARLLRTIPGLGSYTSLIFAAWMTDIERFHSAEGFVHYSGLAPRARNSGDSVKTGHISKGGPAILRYAAVQAAWVHIRVCPQSSITKNYRRLAKRRGVKIAIVATARRLLVVMYAMLSKRQVFTVQEAKPRVPNQRHAAKA